MKYPSLQLIFVLGCWLAGIAWPITALNRMGLFQFMAIGLLALFVHSKPLIRLALLGYFVLIGAGFYQQYYQQQITPSNPLAIETPTRLTILDQPTKYDDRLRYTARLPDSSYAYLTLRRTQIIQPGQTIIVRGPPEAIATKDQASQLSLVRQRIFVRFTYPEILAIQPAQLNPIDQLLIQSRARFNRTVEWLFVEPQAALFAGILAGQRQNLPAEIIEEFKITGLSHLIAVSGFNVTIMINLFTRITQQFGRWPNLFFSLSAIAFVILFTGASASVVRAGLLASLFVLARFVGRKASIGRLLLYTAVIMTIYNPLVLRYDIGFQLSFAAVIGLVAFGQPLEQRMINWPLPSWLRETLAGTIAAQLTTLPLLSFYFNTLSLYSLLANLLIGPLIPLITTLGIPLTLSVGLLPDLSWLGLPIDFALRYSISIAQAIAKLPGAQLQLPATSPILWMLYYALLTYYRSRLPPPEET